MGIDTHGETIMQYDEREKLQIAIETILGLLNDNLLDDLYVEDDVMPHFEGIAESTGICIEALKQDPRIIELLQNKIDNNIKEEIKNWLEAEIEVGGEATLNKLKYAIGSRLAELGVQKAAFLKIWNDFKKDLTVYFVKNFVTQLKNRDEEDSFVAEIESIFSSDSILGIIDALKENKKLFSEKFSSDDWESIHYILDLRITEFLKRRKDIRKEINDRLDEKLKSLVEIIKEIEKQDIMDVRTFDLSFSIGRESKYFKGIEEVLRKFDKAELSKKTDTLHAKILRLDEQKDTFLQFVQEFKNAEDNSELQKQIKDKIITFVETSGFFSGSSLWRLRVYPVEYSEEFLEKIEKEKEKIEHNLSSYQEKLERLQEFMPQLDQLIRQYYSERERWNIYNLEYKFSDKQKEEAKKNLKASASALHDENEDIAETLHSFARELSY